MKPIHIVIGLLLVAGAAACGGEATPTAIPTNAPIIPPTATITPIPSRTPLVPAVTINPLTPTADVLQPSWTPTFTPTATETPPPPPTLTPLPSATSATEINEGLTLLENRATRLTIAENTVNGNFIGADFDPVFEIEPDGIWVNLQIENTFLDTVTRVRAATELELNAVGLTLRLGDFTSEGPTVTRQQVRDALATVSEGLNQLLKSRFAAGTLRDERPFEGVSLSADFIFIDARR